MKNDVQGVDPMLVAMITAIFVTAGIFMLAIGAFAVSDVARRHRTRVDRPNTRITPAAFRRSAVVTSMVSTGLVYGATLACGSRLVTARPVGAVRAVLEAAAILAIYDFAYYLLHRFAFHGWSVGRRIHAVHHTIRTPYANDSFYIHPAETAAGVGLFLGAAALVGPVGEWSFGLAFLVYSLLNIWIHSAITLPFFPLRALSALVHHHDIHHESMKSGYYATLTPLWDVVFGTARRPAAVSAEEVAVPE